MKKRSLLLCLALVLSLTMAIGGTLAYLTDTEYDTNVMTLGNVDIKIEENFDALKPLYPAVIEGEKITGAITKEVFVKNESKTSAAYVRTILAFPALSDGEDTWRVTLEEGSPIVLKYDDAFKKDDIHTVETTIDGLPYTLFVFTYEEALQPGEQTDASLLSFHMNPSVTKEYLTDFDGTYRVDVAAQAVQTNNFDTVYATGGSAAVLKEAFGEIDKDNHPWGDGLPPLPVESVKVSTPAELEKILTNPEASHTFVALTDDMKLTDIITMAPDEVKDEIEITLDLAGNNLTIGEAGTDKGKDGLVIADGATLNIVNSDPNKKTTITYVGDHTNGDAIYVDGGELNISGNVTVEATPKANAVIHATNGAVVNIGEGTKIVVDGVTNSQFTGIYIGEKGGTVNMTGGEITVDSTLVDPVGWSNDVVGVMLLNDNAYFNMTGGTIKVYGAGEAMVQAVQISTYNGNGDAVITIDGGTFNVTGGKDAETCAFGIFDPKEGKVIVTDATFTGTYDSVVSTYYQGTPDITITGGTYAFDPSDYVDTNKYNVTESNGTWYVTDAKTTVATDSSALNDALTYLQPGTTTVKVAAEKVELQQNLPAGVSLSGNGVEETKVTVPANLVEGRTTGLIIQQSGTEISNVTLVKAADISSDEYAAVVAVKSGDTTLNNVAINTGSGASAVTVGKFNEGVVTIANSTIESKFKALHIVDGADGKIVIENSVLSGVYPLNINSGSSKNLVLEVKDSKLCGWTSYSGIGSVTFTNTEFAEGQGYKYFRPYCGTTLTNCSFVKDFQIDATKTTEAITLINCTYDGELLTAENAGVLFEDGTVPNNVTIR